MDAFSGQLKKVNLKKKKPRGSFVINGIRRLAFFFIISRPWAGQSVKEEFNKRFRFGSCPIKKNKKLRKMLALFRDIADDSQVQKGLGGWGSSVALHQLRVGDYLSPTSASHYAYRLVIVNLDTFYMPL